MLLTNSVMEAVPSLRSRPPGAGRLAPRRLPGGRRGPHEIIRRSTRSLSRARRGHAASPEDHRPEEGLREQGDVEKVLPCRSSVHRERRRCEGRDQSSEATRARPRDQRWRQV